MADHQIDAVITRLGPSFNAELVTVGGGESGPPVAVGSTPPASPAVGDLWSPDGHLYMWVGNAWIEVGDGADSTVDAADVTFTSAAGLNSARVGAALDELATDLGGLGAGLGGAVDANTNDITALTARVDALEAAVQPQLPIGVFEQQRLSLTDDGTVVSGDDHFNVEMDLNTSVDKTCKGVYFSAEAREPHACEIIISSAEYADPDTGAFVPAVGEVVRYVFEDYVDGDDRVQRWEWFQPVPDRNGFLPAYSALVGGDNGGVAGHSTTVQLHGYVLREVQPT